jgi:hypothetical protein
VNNLVPTRRPSPYIFAAILLLGSVLSSAGQTQRTLVAGDGQVTHDVPVAHSLAWWTRDPLQLDESGDLLIGPDGGRTLTARDYQVQQKVTTLGTIADHRIVQVLTTIHAGPRVATFGGPGVDGSPAQWKSLLVGVGAERYVEIYGLQSNWGDYKIGSAAIYGSGSDSILGTYDPDGGNGGGCSDGYWWFDKAGAHPVDFTKLDDAIRRAIPKEGTYTPRCWALHAAEGNLESWVQRIDAKCHACGGLGTVHARYRIESGVAIPVSVRFEVEKEQQE